MIDLFLTMFTVLVYIYMFAPIVNPAIAACVNSAACLDPAGQFYAPQTTMLYLLPLVVLICIILAIYNRAFPSYSPQGMG
jgi:hypothetical protein